MMLGKGLRWLVYLFPSNFIDLLSLGNAKVRKGTYKDKRAFDRISVYNLE